MEGPTPVSALIHAATMVTAGVFLIIRCSSLFELSPQVLNFIVFIGGSTCFFAATVALVQHDIKKIIAYSTCSQLGYMVFACGLSAYSAALFHLVTHAFFKALLFLSAGSLIHALKDEQDIRKMGGLYRVMPFTCVVMSIGSLALIGFPFLSGYYSKDLILEIAYGSLSTTKGKFATILGTLSAFLTAYYSFRLVFYVFFDTYKGQKSTFLRVHEPKIYMSLPLLILSILSIICGGTIVDCFLSENSLSSWATGFYLTNGSQFEYDSLLLFYHLLPTIISLFGFLLAFFFNYYFRLGLFLLKKSFIGSKFFFFFLNKWYFDYLYNHFIVRPFFFLSYFLVVKQIDKG